MTTPEHQPPTKDLIYRSPMGIAGGVLLLGIVLWLGIDALVRGEGRTPWLALAALILIVPLVGAFTLRPAVYANEERLRIRNPLRVITVPWGQIAALRSGYSNEVVTKSGTKYQLWAIPVSLRARKKATHRAARAAAQRDGGTRGGAGRIGGLGFGGFGAPRGDADLDGPARAETDKIMDDLRELLEQREQEESAQGEVTVRWAYEVAGPVIAGALLLAILLATD
jgi:hypothetical protein